MNHRRKHLERYGLAAFTRAELLVIVAVLAVLAAMLSPMLTPASKRTNAEAQMAQCRENLRTIGVGLRAYGQDNGGALPLSPTLENPQMDLLRYVATVKYVDDPKVFYCPGESRPGAGYSDENFRAGIIGYYYYGATEAGPNEGLSRFLRTEVTWPRALNTSLDAKTWVMSDIWVSGEPTAHAAYRKGVNYLMLDGSVDFIAESPRQAFH